jgi:glycosyltransferase involved in cell wall biosynthesis
MLSVVITAYNESPSIAALYQQLAEVGNAHGYALDVILVDDGSTDETWNEILRLAADHTDVRGIRLRRNFGKAAALAEGFAASRGDLVITMDADLQDDPAEIPKFLAKMDEGVDVVSGWKRRRRDPATRVLASRVFNWLVRLITRVPLHDHNCGFKCCRREILAEIPLYGELHRFIPVLASSLGYRVDEVEINHRPRAFGKSKYGFARIPKGLLDLVTVQFLTSFRHRPQHLLGTIGLIGFAVGGFGLLFLTSWWFLSRSDLVDLQPIHLHTRPIFYLALTAMVLGSQFMAVGFLAELIVAMLRKEGEPKSQILVAERAGFDEADKTIADERDHATVENSSNL